MPLAEPTTPLRWPCAPLGGDLEWAPAALQTVCVEAVIGLRKLTRRGLEVGGVLFGERAEGLIRVSATRPIECEHRFGPSFVLSDTDEALLQELLADSRNDSELASLELLGCYFSHSRHGEALTERDVELCNRYFAQTGQIALILIPSLSGAVQGTLFTRDPEGSYVSNHKFEHSELALPKRETIRSEAPVHPDPALSRLKTAAKLNYGRVRTGSHLTHEPSVNPVHDPVLGQPQHQTNEVPPLSQGPSVNPVRNATGLDRVQTVKPVSIRSRPETRFLFQVNRASLLLTTLIGLVCWPNRTNQIWQIPLSFTDRDRTLIIQWDTARAAVREAVLGMVDIRDGEHEAVHVSIGPALLRRGWIPYERKSDIVRISFTLAGRGITISENAIYFAPEHKIALPAPIEVKTPIEAKTLKLVDSILPPVREVLETQDAESNTPLPRKPDQSKQPRGFRAPLEPLDKAINLTNRGPAVLPDPPEILPERLTAHIPLQSDLTLSLPAPGPDARAPSSGRLIWTGQLPKHSMLSLTAQGASLGYLNGWIPKAPLHIEVHPGELIEGGIVIFTKDQSLRSESPSLSNGWNTVMYKSDFARATELEVLESPGPANDWSHLILRNGVRSLSVIVIDWRTELRGELQKQ